MDLDGQKDPFEWSGDGKQLAIHKQDIEYSKRLSSITYDYSSLEHLCQSLLYGSGSDLEFSCFAHD